LGLQRCEEGGYNPIRVGAGLPAKAVDQLMKVLADPPLSQASQLPHLNVASF
jgi:hypothetical protein